MNTLQAESLPDPLYTGSPGGGSPPNLVSVLLNLGITLTDEYVTYIHSAILTGTRAASTKHILLR